MSTGAAVRSVDERAARVHELRMWLDAGLPANVADWPEDALAQWHERAGIMEFDGLLPRVRAEREAERLVRPPFSPPGSETQPALG